MSRKEYFLKWKHERQEAGLCVDCGKPREKESTSKWYCLKCLGKCLVRSKRNYRQHPELMKLRGIQKRERERKLVLEKIAKDNNLPLRCPCGCDDISLLQVNHVNGKGAKEFREKGGAHNFYRKILRGERSTKDLNILCQVCNWSYYAQLKSGHHWTIKFEG